MASRISNEYIWTIYVCAYTARNITHLMCTAGTRTSQQSSKKTPYLVIQVLLAYTHAHLRMRTRTSRATILESYNTIELFFRLFRLFSIDCHATHNQVNEHNTYGTHEANVKLREKTTKNKHHRKKLCMLVR